MGDDVRLWIGGYPEGEAAGTGEGIWRSTLDTVTGTLSEPVFAVATPAPTFLALHPDGHTIYAVAEVPDGTVSAFAVDELAPRGTRSTLGAHPCHVVATRDALRVANYTSGTFTTIALGADGAVTGDPVAHAWRGTGPDAERQDGSHAHFSGAVGDEVWVADLGTDELRRYRADGSGVVATGVGAVLPAGSGPRHFVTLDDAVLVATELDSGVSVLVPGTAGEPVRLLARHDASVTPARGGGRNYPSHIALDATGTRLHVAVRGADVLATFAVEQAPDGPVLTHLADTATGGRWPRHFAVIGDLVVVADQYSSDLAVLRMDRDSGQGELVGRHPHPAPACVLPALVP
ncbi:lactonase family protein [Pseudonocardia sp. GCM10023141]|uniref:lactonase family protein n=1 Tax=Pseudonocardia sp. GCM10023141 TaxID=3252653 RepID=UPI00362039AE